MSRVLLKLFMLNVRILMYIFQHADIHQLTDLLSLQLGEKGHVTTYELTPLFTIFVMTHFFYLFNARAFETGRSALHFKGCKGLLTIVAIILIGQVAMVEISGLQQFFMSNNNNNPLGKAPWQVLMRSYYFWS